MKHITATEFPAEVLQSTIPVIVDFSTKACSPCRILKARCATGVGTLRGIFAGTHCLTP